MTRITRSWRQPSIYALALILKLAMAATPSVADAAVPIAASERPNFLIILADDLGFSDLGAFGGEISTPYLDRLANDGLRMTAMHAAPTCSPTRAMLLTGTDHHRAGLANMHELITPSQRGQPGYEGHLSANVVTVAQLLQDAGYRTLMSGKWHLGTAPSEDPANRGFERVFTLLEGGHNHFGKPNLPPPSLGGANYRENGKPVSIPEDFYSSDYFTDRLIQYLGEDGDRPFFAYLPFTAPHWPLHAPADVIARYEGRYDAGWEALWLERVQRQRQLGILPEHTDASPPDTLRDWNELSPEQRRKQARKMEIYAAMVERMDWNIGRLIDALRQSGRLENTVIVFLSDNGAAPDTLIGLQENVPGFPPTDEGDPSRWGGVDSMLAYGPQWAQAGTAPRRLYKSVITEGGLLTPTIIHYPAFARQGSATSEFATVMDVVPTLLDMAGVEHPAAVDGAAIEAVRGRSMLAFLQGQSQRIHPGDAVFGWELFGQRALHRGDWKIAWVSAPNGSGRWELYQLSEDPGERRDLSQQYPDRLREMVELWRQYADEMGIILEEQVVSPHTNL